MFMLQKMRNFAQFSENKGREILFGATIQNHKGT